jgi:hypothetical protein
MARDRGKDKRDEIRGEIEEMRKTSHPQVAHLEKLQEAVSVTAERSARIVGETEQAWSCGHDESAFCCIETDEETE